MSLHQEKSVYTYLAHESIRIIYSDWGHPENEAVICIHGLTGNGQDFDMIAQDLCQNGFRVIAIDMPGRGRSDFLEEINGYNYKNYLAIINTVMADAGTLEPRSVNWIGTSMGGLIGIRLAGIKNSPIRNLVLNDIGPEVPEKDLKLIGEYLNKTYRFQEIAHFKEHLISTRGPNYGPMRDEHWDYMAQRMHHCLPDGTVTYAFDPQIKLMFEQQPMGELNTWSFWDQISCPVLIIRGKKSSIFPQHIAEKMMRRGPGAKDLCTFELWEDCGHVPSLMDQRQIEVIRDWLRASPERA